MTDVSSVKVSLLSIACGWLSAFCIYIIVDVIHPQPPDGALDWIATDIFILIVATPLALALCFVLWAFLVLLPRPFAIWSGVFLICCGALIGWGLTYLFSSFGPAIMRVPKDPLLPSPINFGSLAGAASFATAFIFTRTKSRNKALQPL